MAHSSPPQLDAGSVVARLSHGTLVLSKLQTLTTREDSSQHSASNGVSRLYSGVLIPDTYNKVDRVAFVTRASLS